MTTQYILDKIKNYQINTAGIAQYDVNNADIQSWTPYLTAITNKKSWVILNITDLGYKVLQYVNDVNSIYRYIIGINIFGGLVEKSCCVSNPVTSIDCVVGVTTEYCISLGRTHKSTDVTDDQVPISIIDEGLKTLGITTDSVSINPIYIIGGVAVLFALYYLSTAVKYKIHGSAAKFAGQRYYAT